MMMGLFLVIYIGFDAVSAPRVHSGLERKINPGGNRVCWTRYVSNVLEIMETDIYYAGEVMSYKHVKNQVKIK